jgi:hypothetical protein
VQQELEEANDHLDMHHLEMEANEARSEGEEAPEELGPAPGTNATVGAKAKTLPFAPCLRRLTSPTTPRMPVR